MSDEQNDEPFISLTAAARLVAIDGKPVNASTIWRWGPGAGVGGKHMRFTHIGRRIVTKRSWVLAFLDALTAPRDAAPDADPIVSPKTSRGSAGRNKAVDAAADRLEAAGI